MNLQISVHVSTMVVSFEFWWAYRLKANAWLLEKCRSLELTCGTVKLALRAAFNGNTWQLVCPVASDPNQGWEISPVVWFGCTAGQVFFP